MNDKAPASVSPLPGQPGVYVNEATNEIFKLVEFRDDSKWDSVEVLTTDINNFKKKDFFVTQTDKDDLDTNLDTPRRLSQGETMVIRWIGAEIDQLGYSSNTPTLTANLGDIKKIISFGYLKATINKIMIAEGQLTKFPTGFGLYGNTTENNMSIIAIGMPSTAARKELEKQHFITSNHSINVTVTFQARTWLTTDPTTMTLDATRVLRVHLGGLISAAATK